MEHFLWSVAAYPISELNFTCASSNDVASANVGEDDNLVFSVLRAHKQAMSHLEDRRVSMSACVQTLEKYCSGELGNDYFWMQC
jgi:hypothetical protein